jgi:uncharacterized protein YmfQ (DUF2313 family)
MTTKLSLFEPLPQETQGEMLAKHMPTGKAWEACFDDSTFMGKLVKGLAQEIYRLQLLIKKAIDERDINQTEDLISEWEKSVGIPDLCFTNTVTIAERRNQVLQKFSNFQGAQTATDLIRIAASFGITVTIETGAVFPLMFPIVFSADSKNHTIVVRVSGILAAQTFPLPFALPFSKGTTNFLKCIFEQLVPANVQVVVTSA